MTWLGGFGGGSAANGGKGATIEQFEAWLSSQPRMDNLRLIALHNTDAPDMRQADSTPDANRDGERYDDRQRNIGYGYQVKGWRGGPSWNVYPDGSIRDGTPWPRKGIHSPSWNDYGIGIELVASFAPSHDDPSSGRGRVEVQVAARMFAVLLHHQGMPCNSETVRFHKEDPKTTHSCPGARLQKPEFLSMVLEAFRALQTPGEHDPDPGPAPVADPRTPKGIPSLAGIPLPATPASDPLFRPKLAFREFQALGWPRLSAAALVGNAMRECYQDLRLSAVGDNGTAIGMFQWRLDRRKNLLDFAAADGVAKNYLLAHVMFADHELRTSEHRWGDKLADPNISFDEALRAAISYCRPARWHATTPETGDGWDARKKYAEMLLS